MTGEIISPLSETERAEEQRLIAQIVEGASLYSKSYDLIVPALVEVRNKKLWRSYGSIHEWAERCIGLTSRMVNYYIASAEVDQNLKLADSTYKGGLPITFANLLGKYQPEDQGKIWNSAKEQSEKSGGKLTKDFMAEVALTLTNAGIVELREGVSPPNPNHVPFTADRIKKGWFQLTTGDKAVALSHILKNETDDGLKIIKGMIEMELEKRDESSDNKHSDP